MGLSKQYIRALRREFNQAPIWPQNEVLDLGEYGIYSHGRFISFGNIFEELKLDVKDYLSDDNIVTSSLLVQSERTNKVVGKTDLGNGKFKVNVDVTFEGKKEYMIQIYKFDTESISFKPDLLEKLMQNLTALRWRKKYRIVEQRIIANSVKFAYSHSRNATLELSAETDTSVVNVAELNLGYERSKKVVAETWIDSGNGTPLVNFIKLKTRGSIVVKPQLFAIEKGENDLITAKDKPIVAIDNTDLEFEMEMRDEEMESESTLVTSNGFPV